MKIEGWRAVPQKPLAEVPLPAERPDDWIKYEDEVVFVIFDRDDKVRIRTGHICSQPGSHGSGMEVDNVKKTIVWSDQVLNDCVDSADDAHERSFDPKHPNLFRFDEVDYVSDHVRAATWFDETHPPEIITTIVGLLAKPDFGRREELEENSRKFQGAKLFLMTQALERL